MSKWLYVLDYGSCNVYEEELTEEEYDNTEGEDLIRSLGFNPGEASWMYSPYKLELTTELIEDRNG